MYRPRRPVAAALTLTCAAVLTACGDDGSDGSNALSGASRRPAPSDSPSYDPYGKDGKKDVTGSNCRGAGAQGGSFHYYDYDLTIKNPSAVAFRYWINYVIDGAHSSSEEYVVGGNKTRTVTVREGLPDKLDDGPRCSVFSVLKAPADAPRPEGWS